MILRKSLLCTTVACIALAACSEKAAETPDTSAAENLASAATEAPSAPVTEAPEVMALADIIASEELRSEKSRARDQFRNPQATLEFFGLTPDMTVIEISPGGGWYTDILAPYIATGSGTFVAAIFPDGVSDYYDKSNAAFKEKFLAGNPAYGEIVTTAFAADTPALAEPNSADMVLTFRNVHNWYMRDFAAKAFADFYAVLKPGGILGVVEHRLPEEYTDEQMKTSGYMKTSVVLDLAKAAGFELVAESEVNANPKDTADHPFGVWTLPPVSRTEARDGSVPEGFDASIYPPIGESDRMTLKFKKPE